MEFAARVADPKTGQERKVVLEARTEEEARARLQARGYVVNEIVTQPVEPSGSTGAPGGMPAGDDSIVMAGAQAEGAAVIEVVEAIPPAAELIPAKEAGSRPWPWVADLMWLGLVGLPLVLPAVGALVSPGVRQGWDFGAPTVWQLILLLLFVVPPAVLVFRSGGVDLSLSGVAALTVFLMAALASDQGSLWVSIPVGLACAAALGLVSGLVICLTRAPAAVVTLGISMTASVIIPVARDFYFDRYSPGYYRPELPDSMALRVLGGLIWVAGMGALAYFTPLGKLSPASSDNKPLTLSRVCWSVLPYVFSAVACALAVMLGATGSGRTQYDPGLAAVLALLVGGASFRMARAPFWTAVVAAILVAIMLTSGGMLANAWLTVGTGLVVLIFCGEFYRWIVEEARRPGGWESAWSVDRRGWTLGACLMLAQPLVGALGLACFWVGLGTISRPGLAIGISQLAGMVVGFPLAYGLMRKSAVAGWIIRIVMILGGVLLLVGAFILLALSTNWDNLPNLAGLGVMACAMPLGWIMLLSKKPSHQMVRGGCMLILLCYLLQLGYCLKSGLIAAGMIGARGGY